METTIELGNKKLRLRANAVSAVIYKQQFKSDILKDTLYALGGVEFAAEFSELKGKPDYKQLQALIDRFDTVLIYQLVWTWAKTADSKIPNFYEWINVVDIPPVTDLILEEGFLELLTKNVHRKK